MKLNEENRNAIVNYRLQRARTHNGVFTLFGKHFVLEGVVSKEHNKLYGTLLELRQKGDYEDWAIIEEQDIRPAHRTRRKIH